MSPSRPSVGALLDEGVRIVVDCPRSWVTALAVHASIGTLGILGMAWLRPEDVDFAQPLASLGRWATFVGVFFFGQTFAALSTLIEVVTALVQPTKSAPSVGWRLGRSGIGTIVLWAIMGLGGVLAGGGFVALMPKAMPGHGGDFGIVQMVLAVLVASVAMVGIGLVVGLRYGLVPVLMVAEEASLRTALSRSAKLLGTVKSLTFTLGGAWWALVAFLFFLTALGLSHRPLVMQAVIQGVWFLSSLYAGALSWRFYQVLIAVEE